MASRILHSPDDWSILILNICMQSLSVTFFFSTSMLLGVHHENILAIVYPDQSHKGINILIWVTSPLHHPFLQSLLIHHPDLPSWQPLTWLSRSNWRETSLAETVFPWMWPTSRCSIPWTLIWQKLWVDIYTHLESSPHHQKEAVIVEEWSTLYMEMKSYVSGLLLMTEFVLPEPTLIHLSRFFHHKPILLFPPDMPGLCLDCPKRSQILLTASCICFFPG